jgi:hypothetical protein
MPGVFRVSCSSCGFEREGVAAITIVVGNNGSEIECPHPAEVRTAEEATGMEWRELVSQQRIRHRHALVCLDCGRLDYYGPDQLPATAHVVAKNQSWAATSHMSPKQAKQFSCSGCSNPSLYPLSGNPGCLAWVWALMARSQEQVNCPMCRKGVLRFEIIAVS